MQVHVSFNITDSIDDQHRLVQTMNGEITCSDAAKIKIDYGSGKESPFELAAFLSQYIPPLRHGFNRRKIDIKYCDKKNIIKFETEDVEAVLTLFGG